MFCCSVLRKILQFQNEWKTMIPELLRNNVLGIIFNHSANIRALRFWNATKWAILRIRINKRSRMCWNLVFWSLWFWDVPEWLKNVIFRTFFVLKSPFFAIPEWRINKGSRTPRNLQFQNTLKSGVLEPSNSMHSRMAKKCYFKNVFHSEIPLFWPFRNG